jgi:PTS system nitrogen regulatory IIA component
MIEEDFDIASLAAYLHINPDQVRKMVERGKLPGRRIGGEWKFSPPEIHAWFEQRIGLSDEKELSVVEKVLEQQPQHQTTQEIDIAELLTVDRIFVPLPARTKNSVTEKICELSSLTGALWEPAKMAEALRSREELHPTALENGVALLHPRRPMPNIMGEPFLSLGVTSTGIPFGGPRGCLTDLFFLIGSTSEPQHLRLLARLSRLLQQDDLLDQIRAAGDARDVWQILADADAG